MEAASVPRRNLEPLMVTPGAAREERWEALEPAL
jgi:hypothetical protein